MIALVVNPDSGGGADEVADAVRSSGAELASFSLDQLEAAVAARPSRIVAAGGDGSLAPVAEAAARAGIPLGVIPTGTANDFARAMQIPLATDDAIRIALESPRTRQVDLARIDRRPFLNAASLGLSPVAASHASGLKNVLGALAYTAGALRAGLRADPVPCTVRGDGEVLFEGRTWQVTVACTGAFGGGSSVEADPADGRLDIVAVEAGSRARLVRHAYGMRAGDIGGQPGVHSRRCESAQIELQGTETFNVDGELVESGTCEFSVEPAAVTVVVG